MIEPNPYTLVFSLIPKLEQDTVRNKEVIQVISNYVIKLNEVTFGQEADGSFDLIGNSRIIFPFYSFGNVRSHDHLEYRELVIFSIYQSILKMYTRFLDVGGNLGLHSIVASKLSNIELVYIEPDPKHVLEATKRFQLNGIEERVQIHQLAISSFEDSRIFVRVLNNTTGSHLEGRKNRVYGPIETLDVQVSKLHRFISKNGRTLAKIDIEGAESEALGCLSEVEWDNLDCIVEITDLNSAQGILNMSRQNGLNIYSQKISWNLAVKLADLPHNWSEGSVLISKFLVREKFLH